MTGGQQVFFLVIAPIMVLAALGLVFARKAVHAALAMALVMVCLGIAFFAQEAPFLGGVQIFVYTGAVMMLFLFVLMVIGVESDLSQTEKLPWQRLAAALAGIGVVFIVAAPLSRIDFGKTAGLAKASPEGNVSGLAYRIFGSYVIAFEVTGALLITAAIGAMVLAHRERLIPKTSQKELALNRIKDGDVKAPLPAPGVYARHNAVDTPALLPDGGTSEASVSRVLSARGQVESVAAAREGVDHTEDTVDESASDSNRNDPPGAIDEKSSGTSGGKDVR